MSIYSAMNTAVSGLRAQSSAMGHLSDNISNSRTIGYKRVDTSFSTLVTNSASNNHQPGGVRALPSYMHDVTGNIEGSQITSNIAINGGGFFSVSMPETVDVQTGEANFGNERYYTRSGDFQLDRDGYLVNSSGYYLNGWEVNSQTGQVNTAAAEPVRISQQIASPTATDKVDYGANLPSGIEDGTTLPANSIQIYDSLGNERTLNLHWTKVNSSEWELEVEAPDADPPMTSGPHTVEFDEGRIVSFDGTAGTAGDPVSLPLTLDYGAGIGTQDVDINLGIFDSSEGTTQFAGNELQLNAFEQNGVPPGSFKSVEIDDKGFVNVHYNNGQTKTYYQVPLVQFYNANALQRTDGNAFQATMDSGTARFNPPGLGANGDILGSALETSNVDIADEFTKMIVAQRTYSANSRVISTSDEMLNEVINLRR